MERIPVGLVRNPAVTLGDPMARPYNRVEINWPTRLNAMAIDPSKIDVSDDGRYSAGEVVFAINLFLRVRIVTLDVGADSVIDARRPVLVRHAIDLMRAALGFPQGLHVTVDNTDELRHVGLGSSSRLIAAVGAAINELYGRPFDNANLLRYLASNHAEECDDSETHVLPVQCLGGSGAAGFYMGSVLVVAGQNTVVAEGNLDSDYSIIVGIPNDFVEKDAQALMDAELAAMSGFLHTGRVHGGEIAYNVLHRMLPAIMTGDLRTVGDVIADYRYRMGSIRNCSFVYDELEAVGDSLRPLLDQGLADVVALSSVGPGFFVITRRPDECATHMKQAGLDLLFAEPHNGRYIVLECE